MNRLNEFHERKGENKKHFNYYLIYRSIKTKSILIGFQNKTCLFMLYEKNFPLKTGLKLLNFLKII